MAGTSEGGKKAYENRDKNEQRESARKGGQNADHEQAARTRGRESLAEAGRKGGEHSHGGGRKKEE